MAAVKDAAVTSEHGIPLAPGVIAMKQRKRHRFPPWPPLAPPLPPLAPLLPQVHMYQLAASSVPLAEFKLAAGGATLKDGETGDALVRRMERLGAKLMSIVEGTGFQEWTAAEPEQFGILQAEATTVLGRCPFHLQRDLILESVRVELEQKKIARAGLL